MKKKIVAILMASIMAGTMLAACGSSDSSSESSSSSSAAESSSESSSAESSDESSEAGDGTYTIGYTVNDLNDTWVSFVIDYVEQWDEEHDEVEVLIGDGKSDVSTQMAVVESWIQMGVDAICLKPVDFDSSITMCESVQEAGIKYVSLQQKVDACDAFVGADGVETGYNQMSGVIEGIGGSGKIAYLAGTEGTLVASEREEGSMQALEENPDCELVAREDGDWLREDATTIVETWITSGIEFDAICAACDEMAIGAIIALENAGIDDVFVSGIDGTEMALEQMIDGKLNETFFADAQGLAYEALDSALALCKGEEVEDIILVDQKVTPDNVDEYMAFWQNA